MQDSFPKIVLSGEVKTIDRHTSYVDGYAKPPVEVDTITINFGVSGGFHVGSITVPGHRPIGTKFLLTLCEGDAEISAELAERIEVAKQAFHSTLSEDIKASQFPKK